ncbi:MAG: glycosyltransferase family 4 protein [Saprospiraceae bacterium]|nr:glycosyltransferase family 4 protein [Saprospiraceae bacterium]
MKKLKNVLFIGAIPPPLNGQSFAFEMAYKHYEGAKSLINQNFEGLSKWYKFFLTIKACVKYLFYAIFKAPNLVYLIGSRSILGSIKDIVCISIFSRTHSKIILHIHGSGFDQFIDSFPNWLKYFAINQYQKVDLFFVLHESMVKEYKKYIPNAKTQVVRNFYDPVMDQFAFGKPRTHVVRIAYLSGIFFQKGIFVLLDAFELLKKKYPYLELHVAGTFNSDAEMSALDCEKVFMLRVTPNSGIYYHGFLSGIEKCEFLNKTDLFVLPTMHPSEGIPISIIEAFRSGCVVISSKLLYLPLLVTELEGKCAVPGSVESLVENIESFILNEEIVHKVSAHNINHAQKHYNLNQYIFSIKEGIEKTMNS